MAHGATPSIRICCRTCWTPRQPYVRAPDCGRHCWAPRWRICALAGPSWHRSAQPSWQSRAPLVIALDLSSATLANDLPPSRLAQARAKIARLLQARAGGQIGLVVFADDAHTVAPLTDDAANLAVFLDALAPDIMPVDGSRADRAIAWSARLLRQAGFDRGDILLLTDHADADALRAAAAAAGDGYRVSAIGLGTAAGAAYRDADGHFDTAQLDASSLRALATAGHGDYAVLSAGDGDLASRRRTRSGPGGVAGDARREDKRLAGPGLLAAAAAAPARTIRVSTRWCAGCPGAVRIPALATGQCGDAGLVATTRPAGPRTSARWCRCVPARGLRARHAAMDRRARCRRGLQPRQFARQARGLRRGDRRVRRSTAAAPGHGRCDREQESSGSREAAPPPQGNQSPGRQDGGGKGQSKSNQQPPEQRQQGQGDTGSGNGQPQAQPSPQDQRSPQPSGNRRNERSRKRPPTPTRSAARMRPSGNACNRR